MKTNYLKKNLIFLTILTLTAAILYGIMGASAAPVSASPLVESGAFSPTFEEGTEGGSNIILLIEIVIGLLLISSLVGIVTERLRIPYTAGLVVIGLILALIGRQESTGFYLNSILFRIQILYCQHCGIIF